MLNFEDYPRAKGFLHFFEEISKIPHGSGNTEKIADYLVGFARERGLSCIRDSADNVIISKKATPSRVGRPGIILQGHTDMVAEKTQGSTKDMTREGLELYRDGDFLRASGTTLGGDDGIAVCYALAILDSSDIEHPDIDAIFTSDEEIGLIGAKALDAEMLKKTLHGSMLINIDSDAEGIFTVGCAGGLRSDITLPHERCDAEGTAYKITISGLKGGHSGVEIDKGRANAVKLLFELLSSLEGYLIAELSGGNADNAIPREAICTVISDGDFPTRAAIAVNEILGKYREIEPDIAVTVTPVLTDTRPLTTRDTQRVVELICALPSGVMRMMEDIEGLVETSLNLGIARLLHNTAEISFSIRSAKAAEKRKLADTVADIAKSFGAEVDEHGDYPAWEYRKDSPLREVMCRVYKRMYGKDAEVVTIHAGLECGILSEKIDGLDCVSIGPDNLDIHTTEERLSIPSAVRVWEFLLEILKEI